MRALGFANGVGLAAARLLVVVSSLLTACAVSVGNPPPLPVASQPEPDSSERTDGEIAAEGAQEASGSGEAVSDGASSDSMPTAAGAPLPDTVGASAASNGTESDDP